ncbi:MAG: tetratricopeptide repeat protein [Candidatus Riflebacteria bacterium]|nr:tetratricopeptide repeat protein [Candidatus Riflebacteria bacterium]
MPLFKSYFRTGSLALLIGLMLVVLHSVGAQPVQVTPEFQRAMQQLAQGAYDAAVEELKPLLGQGKSHAPAMVEIGKIRIKQAEAQMSSALVNFTEAADMLNGGLQAGGVTGPELPKTLYDLARVYEERIKNYSMAIEIYQRIIDEHPAFLAIDRVYYNLASSQEAIGQVEQAAENYRKIVSDYSYSTFFSVAQERMKKLAVGTGAQENALSTLEEVVDSSGSQEEARASMDLGDMQTEAGNFGRATTAYRAAIAAANDQEEALQGYRKLITVLDEKQKDYEGAAKALEEMMQKYPDASGCEDLVYRLGRIYEQDLDSMKTTVIDGRVRYRKSPANVEKALKYYNSVTEKFPDADVSADAFLRKGELYEKELRDYDKARKSYQEFLRQFPTHDEAENIRERLREIDGY